MFFAVSYESVLISIHAPQWGATRKPRRGNPILGHFNPRTPVGCDDTASPRQSSTCDFNPRTPVGCDVGQQQLGGLVDISIHAPQWGATTTQHPADPRTLFQSTHPSGVRPLPPNCLPPAPLFQSTHPSGVRPRPSDKWGGACRISIHAPQWGATPLGLPVLPLLGISIHAPQWGATWLRGTICVVPRNFNPRTPVGCDREDPEAGRHHHDFNPRTPVGCDRTPAHGRTVPTYFNPRTPVGCDLAASKPSNSPYMISIHAPQWGATARFQASELPGRYFNPRTPVGCDSTASVTRLRANSFQSTHPSGVRLTPPRLTGRCCNFNPRTPVGCDVSGNTLTWRHGDFNPRTPVGCDGRSVIMRCTSRISIHAPQWGATVSTCSFPYVFDISIHAPQWGATAA